MVTERRTRTSSTTTRIKTLYFQILILPFWLVLEHLPPQQGLRQGSKLILKFKKRGTRTSSTTTRIKTCLIELLIFSKACTRTSSTTTRIKTICEADMALWLTGTRTSSTTTRIKTQSQTHYQSQIAQVLEHLPPQQGLRRLSPLRIS